MKKHFTIIVAMFFLYNSVIAQEYKYLNVCLNRNSEIEIGSKFIGLEFHDSHPLPQRISFYYPLANSFDQSNDYWNRDTSFVMNVYLSSMNNNVEFNKLTYEYCLTPYSADFYNIDKKISISYRFLNEYPAFVMKFRIKNTYEIPDTFIITTKHSLTIRTSHTYEPKDSIKFKLKDNQIFVEYQDKETSKPVLFVLNKEQIPEGTKIFFTKKTNKAQKNPVLQIYYKKYLQPGKEMLIEQIIGMAKKEELYGTVKYIRNNYKRETEQYEKEVLDYAFNTSNFKTGSNEIDFTVNWAQAILAVNKHYLNSDIVPMPCPAEYNFYFTHDVLMTDLSAVNYDLHRVKNDLEFIVRNADKDFNIPHAFYWKDSAYHTEYAIEDNWNNQWFIIVTAEYLKHSSDTETIRKFLPHLSVSINNILKTLGEDSLIWSYRPDWWDIGKRYGPRSYVSILTARAIESYLFIISYLNIESDNLVQLEKLKEKIIDNLNRKLWNDKYGYLMNYSEPGVIDTHYYCGSLLAAHFNLIDTTKKIIMINKAKNILLNEEIGIYNVSPMDFDELTKYWNFVGNEAGDKYYYLNGGIWYHNNAWYALALLSSGKKEEAFNFVKKIMTIEGIMNTSGGQPAMYEVRNGNKNDMMNYGTVDKPQFLWAAGWYLKTLYHIYGLNDNGWNIELDPFLPSHQKKCSFDMFIVGRKTNVIIERANNYEISLNNKKLHSFVLPYNINNDAVINIKIGKIKTPFIKSTNSSLEKIEYKNKKMKINLNGFLGHKNITKLLSPIKPKNIKINNNNSLTFKSIRKDDLWLTEITFNHNKLNEEIEIEF